MHHHPRSPFLLRLGLLLALLMPGLLPAARAQEAAFPGRIDSLVYKQVEGRALKLDLYYPAGLGTAPAPVHVYIHGGGWRNNTRANARHPRHFGVFTRMAEAGVVGVAIDYRLAGEGVTMRDIVTDAKDAIRFLHREGPRLGIDPARMVVWGGSAGGHLAMMAAFTGDALFPGDPSLTAHPSRVRAVASWYGPTDLAALAAESTGARSILTEVMGAAPDSAAALYREMSPIHYLSAGSVPVLLLTGAADPLVPPGQSERLHRAAEALGVRSQYVLVENAGHVWQARGGPIAPTEPEIHAMTAAFLLQHLTP